jgi:hypothetical protein
MLAWGIQPNRFQTRNDGKISSSPADALRNFWAREAEHSDNDCSLYCLALSLSRNISIHILEYFSDCGAFS